VDRLDRDAVRPTYVEAPMTAFSVQVDTTSSECRLLISGDLDLSVSQHVTEVAIQCVRETTAEQIVIDLGAVTFLDSAGLAALAAVRRAALAVDREIVLANVSERSLRVLAITGLDQVLTVRDATTDYERPA
jgi:anti-sigma B factor antagonist